MTETAQLEDGRVIEYLPEMIGEGTMKEVYFTKDQESVLCFYKGDLNQTDPQRLRRLQQILTGFNPTLSAKKQGDYWSKLFCWPTGIIVKPRLGVMTPVYPSNYFFASGRWQGREKKGRWFVSPKLRNLLPVAEQGSWINYFKICIVLARAVRRLHAEGLAHSDLSDNNVLIDPVTGQALVIDIDSLVVPNLFSPDVDGTPGYIAPEVLATAGLRANDPHKKLADIRTDQHALAVLIYEYLLNRHPLRGPKVHSIHSAEEDEQLSLGEKALFIEHPQDSSNRPATGLSIPVTALGPTVTELCYKAFVKGLHSPYLRPAAYEWERGLIKTWNMLYPCPNPNCTHHWFVVILTEPIIKCPFCQTPVNTPIPLLMLRSEKRPGQWLRDGELVIYHGQSLFKWHVFDNIFPGPEVDREPQAYCSFHQNRWLLINQALTSLTSANGNRVDISKAVELKAGSQLRLSQESHGCIAEVSMLNYGR